MDEVKRRNREIGSRVEGRAV